MHLARAVCCCRFAVPLFRFRLDLSCLSAKAPAPVRLLYIAFPCWLATNAARTMATAPSLFFNAIHYAGHFCWPSASPLQLQLLLQLLLQLQLVLLLLSCQQKPIIVILSLNCSSCWVFGLASSCPPFVY